MYIFVKYFIPRRTVTMYDLYGAIFKGHNTRGITVIQIASVTQSNNVDKFTVCTITTPQLLYIYVK